MISISGIPEIVELLIRAFNKPKTSAMKKYRLKKDYSTPGVFIPIGTVSSVTKGLCQEGLYFGDGFESFYVTLKHAQNHPDWFEEVKEEPVDVYKEAAHRAVTVWLSPRMGLEAAAAALREKYIIIPRDENHIRTESGITFILKEVI